MGAKQSSSIPTKIKDSGLESVDGTIESPVKKKKKSQFPTLKGFQLVEHNCRKKRRSYDRCSNKTHSSFLSGKKKEEESCDDLFETYKNCIFKGMKNDRDQRNLPPPATESALGEFEEEEEEE